MAEVYAQGNLGSVGLGVQGAAIGTSVQPSKWQGVSPDVSLQEVQEGKRVSNNVYASRRYYNYVKGRRSVSGSFSGDLTPDDIFGGIGWACLLGNNNAVSGDAAAGYTHTFDEENYSTSKFFSPYGATIDIHPGSATSATLLSMVGCFLNKLTLNCPSDDAVTFTSDWVGAKLETAGALGTPSYSFENPFEGGAGHVDLQIGAAIGSTATVSCKDITFSCDNQISMIYQHASAYPTGRVLGGRNIEVSFVADLQDNLTLFNYYNLDTPKAMKIILTHTALAGSSSGAYSITISLPKVVFLGDQPNLSGATNIDQPMKCQALYDATAQYMIKVEVKNSESGAYTV